MNRRRFLQSAAALAAAPRAALSATPISGVMTPVLTRAYDNARSGANLHESTLTRNAVIARGIRRITTIPVYGDARGMEAQPLILPSTMVKGPVGDTLRDIILLPSMANVVRCCDALTGEGLWAVTLGPPVNGGPSVDFHVINDHWGVLSTGVIDPDTKRLYLVAWSSPDGSPARATHSVYVLNLYDGSLVCPPVSLAGQKSGTQTYSSAWRKQRSSLLMTNVGGVKTVFFASGTVLEVGSGAAGWVFAFDCATNTVAAALAMSQGRGAGVWMAGQGLAADKDGYLYGVSGNGSFNAITDWGECAFKLKYTPPTEKTLVNAPGTLAVASTFASLQVVDWWSPYTDSGRIGGNPTLTSPMIPLPKGKLAGMSAPTEEVNSPVNATMSKAMQGATMDVGNIRPKMNAANSAFADEDFGSAGGTLLESLGVYLCAGKDGIGYPVNSRNMGRTQPADFIDAKANCAKLTSPPVWMTNSPGPVDPCPQDVSTLNFLGWGKTRHMHSTPVQYLSPTHGHMVFVWGENSQLHAWQVTATGMTYLAQGVETASIDVLGTPGGMPGGFMCLSADGSKPGTAVLWAVIPYGDANATITGARLLAYDPENFIVYPDGSQGLRVIWDSQRWGITFTMNKFNVPVVSGGRLFVANYSGGVEVFGLA